MRVRRWWTVLAALLVLAGTGVPVARALDPLAPPVVDPTVAPGRDTEPIVLQGSAFGDWSARSDVTAMAPDPEGAECIAGQDAKCTHNQYENPTVTSGDALGTGVPVDKLLGFRWNAKANKFQQIPFQVDELAVRYLSNNNSGFSVYSWSDQHPTYVFDQERFRWTAEDALDPCHAVPRDGVTTTPDPVQGLDDNDEVSFMASDAGPAAPATAGLPKGTTAMKKVAIADPYDPSNVSYIYVALAGPKGPKPAFDARNGYVRYEPDSDSDTFMFSESSYGDYGNTYQGAWFDPATGTCVTNDPKQHRPKDTAWVRTPRYEFRYDGRWLMTELHAAPVASTSLDEREWTYGPDLIDQWKARAFQQRPGGETPCCGYEEEVNNWGRSSILMGWRAGPVRVIRATWGADSSTNNIRTEIFYRDEMRQLDSLRVHVIPPGDGIYSQWDFNAGKMSTYYNPYVPNGVKVDGQNDEVFGNGRVYAAQDGARYQSDDNTGVDPVDQQINQGVTVGTPSPHCPNKACINNDVDVADPTVSGPAGTLNYDETTGPNGTFVDRYAIKQLTPGAGYSLVTTPYYRDDACFDDGTGTDPGIHVKPASTDPDVDRNGNPRACWKPSDGDPFNVLPADHFYQGDIGTHGVHIL